MLFNGHVIVFCSLSVRPSVRPSAFLVFVIAVFFFFVVFEYILANVQIFTLRFFTKIKFKLSLIKISQKIATKQQEHIEIYLFIYLVKKNIPMIFFYICKFETY